MTSIGRRCRDGDVHSRAILITRTLSAASASLLVRVAEEKETNPQLPQTRPEALRLERRRYKGHSSEYRMTHSLSGVSCDRFQLTIFRWC